jgi:hypothetical protein
MDGAGRSKSLEKSDAKPLAAEIWLVVVRIVIATSSESPTRRQDALKRFATDIERQLSETHRRLRATDAAMQMRWREQDNAARRAASWQQENRTLKAKVAELEAKLAAAGPQRLWAIGE